MIRRTNRASGFTIVELLVVIVVIAILAAIIILSYNGITKRATETSLKSDLSAAAKQLAMQSVETGSFPTTIDAIKKSDSTAFQYTSDGTAYCLTATMTDSKAALAFHVSNTVSVSSGACDGHGDGTPPPVYTIGDKGSGGGEVFYDKGSYSSGWRYLEVRLDAPYNLGTYTPWCNTATLLGTSTSVGSGQANTDKMLAGCTSSIAFAVRGYTGGGASNWSVPSLEELKLVRNRMKSTGRCTFGDSDFWTSSESNASNAYSMPFSRGNCSDVFNGPKSQASYAPYNYPVRQF